MRVAVQHTDPEHPNAGIAAYRFGRVRDTPHPITGENLRADDIMLGLLAAAREEFPETDGYRVWPQRLEPVANETGETHPLGHPESAGEWKDIDEDALRERASGEPVDVPLLETTDPDAKSRKAKAEQATEVLTADQEG